MNSSSPLGFPSQFNGPSRGPRRGADLPIGRLAVIGGVLAVLILLFIIGSTGTNQEAEANEDRTDNLEAIVKPALTRAGYGDVVVSADGRTVTISGELATRTDVVAADAVVKSIAEVGFVINNLSHPGQAFEEDIPNGEGEGPGATGPIEGGGATTEALILQSRIAQAAALDPITFQTGSTELTPESARTITEIAQILADNPSARIEVGGHTDSDGEPEANKVLSQTRADAVVTALVGAGVETERLVAFGYGDSAPIASNETGEGKARNRRIEFLLVV